MLYVNKSTCNPDIGKWDTAKVTKMDAMFEYATKFNQKLCWDRTRKLIFLIFHFAGCPGGSCWGTGTWPGECK